MILQSQISKLSNRLLIEQGGRRMPENILERDYCIAWFLVALSRSTLRNKIAFKGGTALRRCYFPEYRFSEDLDFTLLQALSFEELKQEFEPVYEEVKRASNITFRFSRPDPISHQNSYTFYLVYEGPLFVTSSLKEIKVDITIKEKICYAPEELAWKQLMQSLPIEVRSWMKCARNFIKKKYALKKYGRLGLQHR